MTCLDLPLVPRTDPKHCSKRSSNHPSSALPAGTGHPGATTTPTEENHHGRDVLARLLLGDQEAVRVPAAQH